MTRLVRIFVLALVSFGLASAPASARGWGYRHYRHHGGGIDAGHVVLGAIAIAAIASASNKARRDREARAGDYPPPLPEPVAYPRDEFPRDFDRDTGAPAQRVNDREAAVNACAYAAENEAEDNGDRARVSDIEDVVRDGEKFRVRGEVEVERGGDRYGSRYSDKVRFSCVAEDGRVTAFRFDENGSYAYRR